tara:strand:+ start:321039 stop:322205 length:1167 start_codon:yes stop_codon:yes gene_type:complete
MKVSQRLLHSAAVLVFAGTASNLGHAAIISGWNGNNVVTTTGTDGAGETVIYDRAPSATGATTSGKVIFDGDEAIAPGLKIVNQPFSAGGSSAGGCIMASSSATCSSPFQSGKRFKNVLTGPGPVDFVFDTDPQGDSEGGLYRVFHRLINDTGSDIVDFVISLGNGVGQDFVQSQSDDGLSFSTSFLFGDNNLPATSQFPFGLFGDADTNNNFDLDGFFADASAGFNIAAFTEGENDQITSNGIFGPYSSLFGLLMSLDDVPTGAFWDDDNDPDTDDLLIAWLTDAGWEQRRGFVGGILTSIAPETFTSLEDVVANFGQTLGSGVIEDLANLNINYAIDGAAYQGTSFTLRIEVITGPEEAITVPTPASAPLLLAGLGVLWFRRRRLA